MNAFGVLLRIRLLDVLRSRSSTGFVLLFPVVLLAVLGLVFMNGHPFERRYVAIVETNAPHRAVEACAKHLETFDEVRINHERSEAEAMGKLRSRMASAVLLCSADGTSVELRIGERDQIFGTGLTTVLPVPTRIEIVRAPRFGYVHYLFPGILAFSVLTAGLFGMGYPMVLFRQSLFLKKLATTPLRKHTFIAANVATRTILVLVQVVLLLGIAHFGFEMPLGAISFLWIMLISFLGVLVFLGAGFAIASKVKNPELMVDIVSAINYPLVFFSEIFFPLDGLPKPLAAFGNLLPSTEMVRLSRSVLLYGVHDISHLAGGLVLLTGWVVAMFAISMVAFKWHE
ncbi:MAG TPA: ABC transporter permease [Polyangium sp.]|nr:ABC transporter permease [Polyangium sp.]